MRDDELLDALTKVARENDPLADPRWERLAEGSLSEDDERDLVALAAQSDEAREMYEAFRPLDAAARERIAAKLLAGIEKEQPPPDEPAPRPSDEVPIEGAKPPQHVQSKGTATPPPRARAGLWSRVGFVAAGALAVAAMLAIRAGDGNRPVPAYSLDMTGGDKISRRAEDAKGGVPVLGPGSQLSLTLRPDKNVEGAIEVRAFLLQNGRARAWPVQAEVAANGAVLVKGTRDTLFAGVPTGEWEMVLAVGRSSALPRVETIMSPSACADGRCVILRNRVVLQDGGEGAP